MYEKVVLTYILGVLFLICAAVHFPVFEDSKSPRLVPFWFAAIGCFILIKALVMDIDRF